MVEYRGIQLHESVNLYRTNGEFKVRVKKSIDNLIELLEKNNHILKSEYKGGHEKVLIDFQCGHEPNWLTPSSYKHQNIGCPICAGNRPEQGKEKFYSEVKKAGYTLLGEYIRSNEKVKIKCNKGHIMDKLPSNFMSGRRCLRCDKQDPENAKKRFYEKVKEAGYTLLGEYVKSIEKVDAICDKGHQIKILPSSFISQNTRCIDCANSGNSKRQSEQERKSFPLLVKSNGHTLLTPYGQNCEDKVLIDYHCEHEPYWIRPIVYKRSSICPICSWKNGRRKRTKKSEKAFLLLLKSNGHELLSSFINMSEKVLIDFKCEHKPHMMKPNKYKQGGRCPMCSESKGVVEICNWLEDNQFEYEIEYRLPNKRWRYDIYILSMNVIVEVHGRQHYQFEEYFHKTIKAFRQRQQTDKHKKEYAASLGYNYIEVDYREGKPELALQRFLNQFSQYKPFSKNKKHYRRNEKRWEQLTLF